MWAALEESGRMAGVKVGLVDLGRHRRRDCCRSARALALNIAGLVFAEPRKM